MDRTLRPAMEGGKARDLIGDIYAQHRRRLLRRGAFVAVLALVLLLVGIALKLIADRADRAEVLEQVREQLALGRPDTLAQAAGLLEQGLSDHAGADRIAAALALVRAHAWADLGADEEAARAAVEVVSNLGGEHDARVAHGLLALADGDLEAARAEAKAAADLSDAGSVAPDHDTWLRRAAALGEPGEEDRARAVDEALGTTAAGDAPVSRRLHAALLFAAGRADEALAELASLREQSPEHQALAADEALYNALLRQRPAGVASVASALLADPDSLDPRSRARARLARAIVHVQSGERDEGLSLLELAWPELPRWDMLARAGGLELALFAHAGERARAWAEEMRLPAPERELVDAWAALSEGDVMGSLDRLSKLPQTHPRVAYLQGLALVEQRRFAEAEPWLARAEKLIRGRVELAVARARVQVREGDKGAALARLKTLAEEEPYAPGAFTGLGEAHLATDLPDRGAAEKAFERAIEREHRPAEAMLQLARLLDGRRAREPGAVEKARDLLDRAVENNPHLPRYAEARALYLGELGHRDQAIEALAALADRPGLEPGTLLTLCRLATERAAEREEPPPAALDAWLAAAKEAGAEEPRLARERARAAVLTGTGDEAAAAQGQLAALLAADPADVDARALESRAFLRVPAREEAVTALRRGLSVAPEKEQGRLYLEWARIESRSGDRRKAAAHARVAWSRLLAADRSPAELLEAAELAVRLFLRDQKPKPALQIAKTLTERVPGHARAWVIRGKAELADKATAEAQQSAERAIALDENDAEAHELLGDVVLRFGYKDRARQAYERAAALAAGTPAEAAYGEKLGKP